MNTSNHDHSYYETVAPGLAGAICTKCNAIKPAAEFKRKLTKAQSKARGYVGSVRLEIDSSLCRACQPRRKSLTERSAKEIMNLVGSGEMHHAVAKEVIAKNRTVARRVQAEAAIRRWQKVRAVPMREHLAREIARSMTARNYHAKRAKNPEASAAAVAFYDQYLPFLRLIRTHLDIVASKGVQELKRAAPDHWLALAEQGHRVRMVEAWFALPLDIRTAARREPELTAPTPIPYPDEAPDNQRIAELPSERRAREEAAALAQAGEQAQKEHSSLSSDEWLID